MTKQEKLKYGVATLLVKVAQREVNGFDAADQVLAYVASEGGVLKVEREPEEFKKENGDNLYYGDMPGEMYEDGWRKTEPLVEAK